MASNYPSGLDSFTNPAGTDNLSSPDHAAQHANVNDAVRAIETELGTTPKGPDASVAARLARFDANGFVTPIRTSGGYFDTATNYTLTNNDRVVDVTGTTAITLPTSVGSAGRAFTVRNNGAGTVTIGTTGGQLIDGAATLALAGKPAGEDIALCMRAARCGIPVHVYTKVKVGHHKSQLLTEEIFQKQLAEVVPDGV